MDHWESKNAFLGLKNDHCDMKRRVIKLTAASPNEMHPPLLIHCDDWLFPPKIFDFGILLSLYLIITFYG